MRKPFSLLALLVAGALAVAGISSDILPLDDDAIQYTKAPVNDVVHQLQQRMDKGEVSLKYDGPMGYLRSTLDALDISTTSQILVFSKTSFQAPLIGPRLPRALYFNDNVAVGYVRSGDVLEIAALDPQQGVQFYTVKQDPAEPPKFERRDTCLQCHQAATLGIPGLMVRSVFPDKDGMPIMRAGGFITDHRSPLRERWGGWYVTGNTGKQQHMGNQLMPGSTGDIPTPTPGSQNVTDLKPFIDTGAYLTPHSDVVALMTLEHETQMVNLMIRASWETRIAMVQNDAINKAFGDPIGQVRESTAHRIAAAVDDLVDYLFFGEETVLTDQIKGDSGFTEAFEKEGPRDSKGRSLRDYDLKTRMFRYPCSFMVYSKTFDGMPPALKERVYKKMWDVLTLRDNSPKFKHLSPEDRKAILEILLQTKDNLPDYWREGAKA
jgi:hypothetical protein